MNIGIVGSRRRSNINDRKYVFDLVEFLFIELGKDLVIVSGGCKKGADKFAEDAADRYGIKKIIHKPNLIPTPTCRIDIVSRYYDRNKKIAQDSDYLYALVSIDRTGGTENTIEYMTNIKKPITIVYPDFSEGNLFLNKLGSQFDFSVFKR